MEGLRLVWVGKVGWALVRLAPVRWFQLLTKKKKASIQSRDKFRMKNANWWSIPCCIELFATAGLCVHRDDSCDGVRAANITHYHLVACLFTRNAYNRTNVHRSAHYMALVVFVLHDEGPGAKQRHSFCVWVSSLRRELPWYNIADWLLSSSAQNKHSQMLFKIAENYSTLHQCVSPIRIMSNWSDSRSVWKPKQSVVLCQELIAIFSFN